MPISQDRMLKLLEAGEAYKAYFFNLHKSMIHICAKAPEFQTVGQITDEIRLQLDMAMLMHRDADTILTEERANYKHTHSHNASKRERMREKRNLARARGELNTIPRNSDYTVPRESPIHHLPPAEPVLIPPSYNPELDIARAARNPEYLRFKQLEAEEEARKKELERRQQQKPKATGLGAIDFQDDEEEEKEEDQ